HRRHVSGGDLVDLADPVDDLVELAGEAVELVVLELDARQHGDVRDVVAREVGHGCQSTVGRPTAPAPPPRTPGARLLPHRGRRAYESAPTHDAVCAAPR